MHAIHMLCAAGYYLFVSLFAGGNQSKPRDTYTDPVTIARNQLSMLWVVYAFFEEQARSHSNQHHIDKKIYFDPDEYQKRLERFQMPYIDMAHRTIIQWYQTHKNRVELARDTLELLSELLDDPAVLDEIRNGELATLIESCPQTLKDVLARALSKHMPPIIAAPHTLSISSSIALPTGEPTSTDGLTHIMRDGSIGHTLPSSSRSWKRTNQSSSTSILTPQPTRNNTGESLTLTSLYRCHDGSYLLHGRHEDGSFETCFQRQKLKSTQPTTIHMSAAENLFASYDTQSIDICSVRTGEKIHFDVSAKILEKFSEITTVAITPSEHVIIIHGKTISHKDATLLLFLSNFSDEQVRSRSLTAFGNCIVREHRNADTDTYHYYIVTGDQHLCMHHYTYTPTTNTLVLLKAKTTETRTTVPSHYEQSSAACKSDIGLFSYRKKLFLMQLTPEGEWLLQASPHSKRDWCTIDTACNTIVSFTQPNHIIHDASATGNVHLLGIDNRSPIILAAVTIDGKRKYVRVSWPERIPSELTLSPNEKEENIHTQKTHSVHVHPAGTTLIWCKKIDHTHHDDESECTGQCHQSEVMRLDTSAHDMHRHLMIRAQLGLAHHKNPRCPVLKMPTLETFRK